MNLIEQEVGNGASKHSVKWDVFWFEVIARVYAR